MFAFFISTFRGHRPIAWTVWILLGVSLYRVLMDAIAAYKRSAPRRAILYWIRTAMRTPAANDPRLVSDYCAICFVTPTDRNDVRLTVCNHMYHVGCLAQWLYTQNTCPTCRRVLR